MHPRFHTAFSALPATLQSALRPYLDAPDFPAMFTAEQAAAIRTGCGLDDDALAFALLPLAAACSLTPISHFHVGAIARGQSGNLYFGANMEFSGAPLQQTVHAEQCAVTHAWLRGEPALASVTVNYTPCGHCRQFMNELNSGGELQIRLPGRARPRWRTICRTLRPERSGYRFAADGQGRSRPPAGAGRCAGAGGAGGGQSEPCSVQQRPQRRSAGNAGRQPLRRPLCRNAAFNPSLPPLQAALILLNLSGGDCLNIRRAVLAEPQKAILSQWDATRATLAALGCQNVSRAAF